MGDMADMLLDQLFQAYEDGDEYEQEEKPAKCRHCGSKIFFDYHNGHLRPMDPDGLWHRCRQYAHRGVSGAFENLDE